MFSYACSILFTISYFSDDWLNMVTRPDRGQPPDYVEAVFTCQGDYYDPNFPHQLEAINRRLLDLLKAGRRYA